MNCPRCQADINDAKNELVVCSDCGWMPDSKQKKIDSRMQKNCVLGFASLTLAASLLFVHTSTWDEHSVAIVPAKISEALGMATQEQYIDIANMCKDRGLIQCEEKALTSALNQDPKNVTLLGRLASQKYLSAQKDEATTLYRAYFELGGTDSRALYHFANLLSDNGLYEDAENYYVTLLNSKPGILQVTVNEAFVKMLMNSGQLKKAQNHIQSLRKDGAPEYFLNNEMVQIDKKLSQKG